MKDILGREIKDGDMCIGMAIGRNSPGMHIGVFQGSSVVYLGYSEEYINKKLYKQYISDRKSNEKGVGN